MFHTTLVLPIDRKKNQVLLGKIKRGIGKSFINAPGGKLDTGETWRQCACREVFEETGLRILPHQLHKSAYLDFTFDDPSKDHDVNIYIAYDWNWDPKPSDEFDPEWFSLENIPYDQMWSGDHVWLPDVFGLKQPFHHTTDHIGRQAVGHERVGELPTKIILTRHAWAEHNQAGLYDSQWIYSLTQEWHKDAKNLTNVIPTNDIDFFYSSPLKRCIETITPLSEYHQIPIIADERIREIDFGIDDAWPYIPENKTKRLQNLDFAPVGGESFQQVLDRVTSFIEAIKAKHPWETIMICTHGNPGRAFHYILSGYDKQYLQKGFEFPQSSPVEFEIKNIKL